MARFRDPVLKQVVDDLNFINSPPQELKVEQCALGAPVASTAGGGNTNTRATLTITQPDAYYYGTASVYYRRLNLATLFADHLQVLFAGAVTQSKSLLEILRQSSNPLAQYVQNEIQEDLAGTWALNRSTRSITLTAKPGSQVIVGTVSLQVGTIKLDISKLTTAEIQAFGTTGAGIPRPTTNVKERIIAQMLVANDLPAGSLTAADVDFGVATNFVAGMSEGYAGVAMVTITVRAGHAIYEGSGRFRYTVCYIQQFLVDAGGLPTVTVRRDAAYTTTRQLVQSAVFTPERNLLFVAADFTTAPVPSGTTQMYLGCDYVSALPVYWRNFAGIIDYVP